MEKETQEFYRMRERKEKWLKDEGISIVVSLVTTHIKEDGRCSFLHNPLERSPDSHLKYKKKGRYKEQRNKETILTKFREKG
jgi:hypothetical protein